MINTNTCTRTHRHDGATIYDNSSENFNRVNYNHFQTNRILIAAIPMNALKIQIPTVYALRRNVYSFLQLYYSIRFDGHVCVALCLINDFDKVYILINCTNMSSINYTRIQIDVHAIANSNDRIPISNELGFAGDAPLLKEIHFN